MAGPDDRREDYQVRMVKTLSVVILMLAFICLGLQIFFLAILLKYSRLGLVGYIIIGGLCGTVCIIIAGGLGVGSGSRNTTGMIVSVLVMSIFAAVGALVPLAFGVLIFLSSIALSSGYNSPSTVQYVYGGLMFCAFGCFVLLITLSVYACRGVCCKRSQTRGNDMELTAVGGQPQKANRRW